MRSSRPQTPASGVMAEVRPHAAIQRVPSFPAGDSGLLLTSYLAGLVSQSVFGIPIPSYVAGAIGGLAAIPTWDFLKRIRPSQQE